MGGRADSAIIKPINKADVHRICSGQVILDLSSAVKELVENSLDAGASSIEVKLKEYGGESFEVGDNGCGISPDNYQSVTLKYHTSKISAFSDLQSLTSFGFRGEALSSLCALGDVTIVTRTRHETVGTQLTFDHSGLISSQKSMARQIGTTVTVTKLFSSLPVRYKEFSRNIRREYGRLLSLLHAYALIAKGVRIVCTNVTGKNAKNVVLRTQGSGSIKDNIVTVFGTKTLACLDPLDICVSDGCRLEGFLSKPGSGSGRASGDRQFVYVNGRPVDMPKVTKLLNELYKSYNSQQYPMVILNFILPTTAYDVNVTPDKRKIFLHDEGLLMSALRESLEKYYAPNKYTYAINNFESDSQLGHTCRALLSSQNAETKEPSSVEDCEMIENVNDKGNPNLEENRPNVSNEELLQESSGQAVQEDVDALNQKDDDVLTETMSDACDHKASTPLVDFISLQCGNSAYKLETPVKQAKSSTVKAEKSSLVQAAKDAMSSHMKPVQSKLTGFVTQNKRQHEEGSSLSEEPVLKKWSFCSEGKTNTMNKETKKVSRLGSCSGKDVCAVRNSTSKGEDQSDSKAIQNSREDMCPRVESFEQLSEVQRGSLQVEGDQYAGLESIDLENLESEVPAKDVNKVVRSPAISEQTTGMRADGVIAYDGTKLKSDTHTDNEDITNAHIGKNDKIVAQFDINKCRLKSSMGFLGCSLRASSQKKDKGHKKRHYAAATLAKGSVIEDGAEKEASLAAATRELERSFNKEDFGKMKVIGQFNLGFIIAKIDEDLFIIDQHASDEKYNFERLSQTTILNRQPLLRPLALELSAAEEVTIALHLDTFRKNGFDFVEDIDAPPGRRFLLSAVPYSQNITFGVEDVQELLSILADAPAPPTSEVSCSRDCSDVCSNSYKKATSQSISSLCPSKVRAMLASRACRSSVMIGDALCKKDMETILQHLSTLNSPWNCPHGRPTMRHLVDMATVYRR